MATERVTIVIAWVDMTGLRKTGRNVWRDANWFPEVVAAPEAKSVIWLNRGRVDDIAKAEAYANVNGYAVHVFQTTEGDPRGIAEATELSKFLEKEKRKAKS
jgi:hypothetical protein